MSDRRHAFRKPIDVFFNKYLDGYPYLCRSMDLSTRGMLATTYSEPDGVAEAFPVEMRLPGEPETFWIWARTIRRNQQCQALRFVGLSPRDEQRLQRYLAAHSV